MNAITVCVDYHDVLALTLPYNRHHFSRFLVVTSPEFGEVTRAVAGPNRADVYETTAFSAGGAEFNKWAALEEGLDVLGRSGWVCVLDADVCWPKTVPQEFRPGCLTTPLRLMCPTIPEIVPAEKGWRQYPVCGNVNEWAGYCHVFHADDPVLSPDRGPWYDTGWVGAQGGDSIFQSRWKPEHKIRPPFHVLHFGPAGVNWLGRTSPYIDGTVHPKAASRITRLREMLRKRRRGDGYINERIK